ncbi:MAG: peptide chain release factor 1 [Clostridia bacterium]
MIEKLKKITKRYEELTQEIAKPQVLADSKLWQKLVKEHNSLEPIAQITQRLKDCLNAISKAENTLKTETDQEMKNLFEEEVFNLKKQYEQIEKEIQFLLLPKDENDEKSAIVEIRSAVGGEESGLFGMQLLKMYTRFAERKHLKIEMINFAETELGGLKEAVFSVVGKNVFQMLKYESGVHRVQRVPETENQGRIHTSTCTVAVLPEVEDVEIEILDKDIKVDTYRSSGAGGQHVNKTESAIRITHIATGIVVACQDERSQIKNREKAMSVLRAKLKQHYEEIENSKQKNARKIQVGTGDRSERIRTYNFPQGRVTDHRTNFTTHNFMGVLDGDLDELIQCLSAENTRKLLSGENN